MNYRGKNNWRTVFVFGYRVGFGSAKSFDIAIDLLGRIPGYRALQDYCLPIRAFYGHLNERSLFSHFHRKCLRILDRYFVVHIVAKPGKIGLFLISAAILYCSTPIVSQRVRDVSRVVKLDAFTSFQELIQKESGQVKEKIPEISVDRKKVLVGKLLYDELVYSRRGTKILKTAECNDIGHFMSWVYDPGGKCVYQISAVKDEYLEKEIHKLAEIAEIDTDLNGTFDLVVVTFDRNRTEYFELVDQRHLVPLPSKFLNIAQDQLREGIVANEDSLVIEAYRKAKAANDTDKLQSKEHEKN